MLGVIDQDRSLHIRPLSDEVSERLQLDRVVRPEIDGIGAKLDRPFNYATAGFLIPKDIAKWVLSNHCYGVGLEVVAELLGCD